VHFLVDTGAGSVVLTLADAAAAGISRGSLDFSARISTANGIARAAPVRLRDVRIGQLSVNGVSAFVGENLHVSLLGMSFLKRIEGFEIRDGVLTLNWQ
jgi:aspartyl protease family protein